MKLQLQWLWFMGGFGLLALIALLSLIPISDDIAPSNDKLAHLGVYAFLSGWFSLLVVQRSTLLWIWGSLTSYGLLIEFLQNLTNYRSAEFTDVIANSIGITIGLIVYYSPLRDWFSYFDHWLSGFFRS